MEALVVKTLMEFLHPKDFDRRSARRFSDRIGDSDRRRDPRYDQAWIGAACGSTAGSDAISKRDSSVGQMLKEHASRV